MQFSKWKIGAIALVCMLLPGSVHAQIVKNERLLSFEEKQVPAFVTTAAGSQLGISDEHYRDGDHSLSWTFEPGAALSIKKDLKFEKKDPTGKDTYLSAFIVWVYNEQAGQADSVRVPEGWQGMHLFSFWHQLHRLARSMGML